MANVDLERIAKGGKKLNIDIKRDYFDIESVVGVAEPFMVALVDSLAWTGHALGEDDFFRAAIEYFDKGKESQLRVASSYAARFGSDRLAQVLKSWNVLLSQNQPLPDIQSAEVLGRGQSELFDSAASLSKDRKILGIGPWLFCAPFKILVISQPYLSKDPKASVIWQPLGMEVIRGLWKAKQMGFFKSVTSGMLIEEEGGLIEGMGTVTLVHEESVKLAEQIGVPVSEINSGLYVLGKGEI